MSIAGIGANGQSAGALVGFAVGRRARVLPVISGPSSPVTIGKTASRVARYIEGGFAVELIRLQHHDVLEENVTGR